MMTWELLGTFVKRNFIRSGRTITSRRRTLVGRRTGLDFRRWHRLEMLEDRRLLTSYIVDTLIDDPLALPADMDGVVSLREAMEAANRNLPFGDAMAGESGGAIDTISFADSLSGQTIVLGGEQLTISDQLSIHGLGRNQLTLGGNGASRIFLIETGVTAELSDMTITGGAATDGGGIYNKGTLTITNSALTHNTASNDGGAIDNLGSLTVDDSQFSNNWASYGGAIVSWSLLIASPSLTISNSSFDGNYADGEGGALWNDSLLQVVDSTFSRNASNSRGGAIVNDGTFNLTNGTFVENTSVSNGGAIKNYTNGKLAIADSTFTSNTAGSAGGAIDTFTGPGASSGSLDVANSTFTSNSGSSGGAIWNWMPANISNSTFVGNSARLWGGAFANAFFNSEYLTTISDSSFANNHAGYYGGAIRQLGCQHGAHQ